MSDNIVYEQPLNERVRILLRLEFLFSSANNALQGTSELKNRDTINALLSILSVFDRTDLKQEIIKELERLISALSALENMPGVDKQALNNLLQELDTILDPLHLIKTAIGHNLRENDFLFAIRQRSSIPGGTCDFDIPAYHFWLQHISAESRQQQLQSWLNEFSHVRAAIDIILKLIRGSTGFSPAHAQAGFYQHSLDSSQANQIIQVKIPRDTNYYPEISGGKHRFTVRFMQFNINQRPQQCKEDIDFSLSCCAM